MGGGTNKDLTSDPVITYLPRLSCVFNIAFRELLSISVGHSVCCLETKCSVVMRCMYKTYSFCTLTRI